MRKIMGVLFAVVLLGCMGSLATAAQTIHSLAELQQQQQQLQQQDDGYNYVTELIGSGAIDLRYGGGSCPALTCPGVINGCHRAAPHYGSNGCVVSCGAVSCPATAQYSRNWSPVISDIFSNSSEDVQINAARNAGLVVDLDSGDLSGENEIDLMDPVTLNSVATIHHSMIVNFNNVNGSSLNGSHTATVCLIDGAYFFVSKDKAGNAHIDGVEGPGQSNITINLESLTKNGADQYDVLGACNAAASTLSNGTGLHVSCGVGLPTKQSPATQINVEGMYIYPGVGGTNTKTDRKTNTVYADIGIDFKNSAYLGSGKIDLASVLEHEILHGLGLPHDASSDVMSYSYILSSHDRALPANVAHALSDITNPNTNVNVNAMTDCMKMSDYVAMQCANDPNFQDLTKKGQGCSQHTKLPIFVCNKNQHLDASGHCVTLTNCTCGCSGNQWSCAPFGCDARQGYTCTSNQPGDPCACSCSAQGYMTCTGQGCQEEGQPCSTLQGHSNTCICFNGSCVDPDGNPCGIPQDQFGGNGCTNWGDTGCNYTLGGGDGGGGGGHGNCPDGEDSCMMDVN